MIPVKEIYENIKTLQHKITWHRGRITTCEAQIKKIGHQKSKAKSYEQDIWFEKEKNAVNQLELARNELVKAITNLKTYLNGRQEL